MQKNHNQKYKRTQIKIIYFKFTNVLWLKKLYSWLKQKLSMALMQHNNSNIKQEAQGPCDTLC